VRDWLCDDSTQSEYIGLDLYWFSISHDAVRQVSAESILVAILLDECFMNSGNSFMAAEIDSLLEFLARG
jgi:hypothetical protein